jgi:hypothetical protein
MISFHFPTQPIGCIVGLVHQIGLSGATINGSFALIFPFERQHWNRWAEMTGI